MDATHREALPGAGQSAEAPSHASAGERARLALGQPPNVLLVVFKLREAAISALLRQRLPGALLHPLLLPLALRHTPCSPRAVARQAGALCPVRRLQRQAGPCMPRRQPLQLHVTHSAATAGLGQQAVMQSRTRKNSTVHWHWTLRECTFGHIRAKSGFLRLSGARSNDTHWPASSLAQRLAAKEKEKY